jgi:hypothetical protein
MKNTDAARKTAADPCVGGKGPSQPHSAEFQFCYGFFGGTGFVFRAGVVLPGFATATVTSPVEVFPAASVQATVMV